jgi:hypothetical protein
MELHHLDCEAANRRTSEGVLSIIMPIPDGGNQMARQMPFFPPCFGIVISRFTVGP